MASGHFHKGANAPGLSWTWVSGTWRSPERGSPGLETSLGIRIEWARKQVLTLVQAAPLNRHRRHHLVKLYDLGPVRRLMGKGACCQANDLSSIPWTHMVENRLLQVILQLPHIFLPQHLYWGSFIF